MMTDNSNEKKNVNGVPLDVVHRIPTGILNLHADCFYTGAAEITPTFQRGITNKWYEISPKTFYFSNVDITKFFLL
jgi:hypothetical protein